MLSYFAPVKGAKPVGKSDGKTATKEVAKEEEPVVVSRSSLNVKGDESGTRGGVEKSSLEACDLTTSVVEVSRLKNIMRAARLSMSGKGKGKKASQTFTTWVNDSRTLTTTGTGQMAFFLDFESILAAQQDFTALGGMFDNFRVKRVLHHYEPYRQFNMVVGASTAGSELSAGVPMAWRVDVEAPTGSTPLTMTQILLAPPTDEVKGSEASLGCVFGNTNRPLRHKASFAQSKMPIVAESSGGAVTSTSLGQWLAIGDVARMAGGLYFATANDANASNNTSYGVLSTWFEVEFAIRV